MSVVKWFNTYLKECLNKKSVSIKMLCDETKLNYTKVLKIVKGDCKCSLEELDEMLKSKFFTEDEKKYIKESFQYTNISPEEKNDILEIENILKNLYETVIERATFDKNLLEAKGQVNMMSKLSTQVNDQLYKSYTATLKDIFLDGSGVFGIILYLPAVPALINEIYHTIKALKACLDKRVVLDITCVIDGFSKPTESYFNQYSHFLKYIKLATLSEQITMKVMEPNELGVCYGMYFKDRTVLINDMNFEVTVLHTDMLSKFDNIKLEKNPLVTTNFSKSNLTEYIQLLLDKKEGESNHYSVMNTLNPSFLGREFIDKSKCSCKREHKEMFEVYYKNEMNKVNSKGFKKINFICESGLELLLAEGVMPDYASIASPIDDVSRLALVFDTLERMRHGCNIRLLPKETKKNYPHIGIIQYFEIHKVDDAIILKGHKKSNGYVQSTPIDSNDYVQLTSTHSNDRNYEFVINDKNSILAFELFCEKVMNYLSLDSIASFNIIKSIAVNNYAKHKCPEISKLVKSISELEIN